LRRLGRWLPVFLYLAIVFWLSAQSRPLPFLPPELWGLDKLLHAAEYAVLGGLLASALGGEGLAARRVVLWAAILASGYGASDEIHQAFVPDRSCDLRDWIADAAGAAVGAGFTAFLQVRRSRASIVR
jgi:VanZ family protein